MNGYARLNERIKELERLLRRERQIRARYGLALAVLMTERGMANLDEFVRNHMRLEQLAAEVAKPASAPSARAKEE